MLVNRNARIGDYFQKAHEKKTKIGNTVVSSFAHLKMQGCHFSSSNPCLQKLQFPSKHWISSELKTHFYEAYDSKVIKGVAEFFGNQIIDSDDVKGIVGNIMLEKKFILSDYAPVYQDEMTRVLINGALEIQEV